MKKIIKANTATSPEEFLGAIENRIFELESEGDIYSTADTRYSTHNAGIRSATNTYTAYGSSRRSY